MNAEFDKACLEAADLTGADLTNAYLEGAVLTHAILVGANLTNADLSGANLSSAQLEKAILDDADLTGATIKRATGLTQQQLDAACANAGEEPEVSSPKSERKGKRLVWDAEQRVRITDRCKWPMSNSTVRIFAR